MLVGHTKPYKYHGNGLGMEEVSEKEKRVRGITKLYYSQPKIQRALLSFSAHREVVPRYFEGFGKRPDSLQYSSDIMGLVGKGATSFHCSEELWHDPLQLSLDLSSEQIGALRKGWDLLIDIDSPFLDYSHIAASLLIERLEQEGIKNYGIKFSGSKGFHIIVGWDAFPKRFEGVETSLLFPDAARAICQYLESRIRTEFNRRISTEQDIMNLQIRTNKKRGELVEGICPRCGATMEKNVLLIMECKLCKNETRQRKSVLAKKRILRCMLDNAPLEIVREEDILECVQCGVSNVTFVSNENEKLSKEGRERQDSFVDAQESIKQKESGGFDLVLVAPRHLFRMPYSLHEKTALASIVLGKEQLAGFSPKDADPMNVVVQNYAPIHIPHEAERLLVTALSWKREREAKEEGVSRSYKEVKREKLNISGVPESAYPPAIQKLMKGLHDGKKRGLFILLTFLRSINVPVEEVAKKVKEWNKKNQPPLREGYVQSQLDWQFRQKKVIFPPNYSNDSFYKDLGLLEKKPESKNPVVDVLKAMRKR